MSRPAAFDRLAPWATAGLGAVFLAAASARVVGFTTDSDSYLDVAANVRLGRGLVQTVVDFWRPGVPDPLGMWPPLYPTLVAVVSAFGVPLEAAALLVTAASFFAFAVGLHLLARRVLEFELAQGVAVAAQIAPVVLLCGVYAWSEATYLALVTWGMLGLAALDRAPAAGEDRRARVALAAAAGAAFGLAALTRYAGVPIACAAVVAVALWPRARGSLVPFAIAALVPPLVWIARDFALFGRPFGPALPHASTGLAANAVQLARSLRWELVPAPLDALPWAAAIVLVVIAAGVVLAMRRSGAVQAIAGFAALSLLVTLVATSTSAINAPSGRYLAPALPFVWLAAAAGLAGDARSSSLRRWLVFGLVVLFALGMAGEFVRWQAGRPRRAIASLERRNDRAALAALVPKGATPVLSDASHALRLASGRAAVQIPPLAYRPRAFGASDLARWKALGVTTAIVVRGGESDSTLHALGARTDAGGGRFVRLALP